MLLPPDDPVNETPRPRDPAGAAANVKRPKLRSEITPAAFPARRRAQTG